MILKVTPHSEISSRVLFIFRALSLFCLSLCLSLCSFVLSFLVLNHLPLILVLVTVLYLLTEHSRSLSHTLSLYTYQLFYLSFYLLPLISCGLCLQHFNYVNYFLRHLNVLKRIFLNIIRLLKGISCQIVANCDKRK